MRGSRAMQSVKLLLGRKVRGRMPSTTAIATWPENRNEKQSRNTDVECVHREGVHADKTKQNLRPMKDGIAHARYQPTICVVTMTSHGAHTTTYPCEQPSGNNKVHTVLRPPQQHCAGGTVRHHPRTQHSGALGPRHEQRHLQSQHRNRHKQAQQCIHALEIGTSSILRERTTECY